MNQKLEEINALGNTNINILSIRNFEEIHNRISLHKKEVLKKEEKIYLYCNDHIKQCNNVFIDAIYSEYIHNQLMY